LRRSYFFAIPHFYLINSGNFLLVTIAEVIRSGFVFGFGTIPASFVENFPLRYRASGASAGSQIAQIHGGGLRAYGIPPRTFISGSWL
jgi:hypothetical protein